MLGDVKHDRPRLEQGEVAVLIGRNLAKRMRFEMRRFLHGAEGNQADVVGLADLLQRPADARIPRQPLAAVG